MLTTTGSEVCAICFEGIEKGRVIGHECLETSEKASHLFHQHCLKEWLKDNSTCPTCRYSDRWAIYENEPDNGFKKVAEIFSMNSPLSLCCCEVLFAILLQCVVIAYLVLVILIAKKSLWKKVFRAQSLMGIGNRGRYSGYIGGSGW